MASPYEAILGSPRGKTLVEFLGQVRKPWTKEHIETVLRAQGYCEYCGADLLASPEAFWSSEWEHIIPRARGGEDCFETNIALACRTCNNCKGAELPEKLQKLTEEQIRQMTREERLRLVRPLVWEYRNQAQIVEAFEAFRGLVEMVRCG